MCDCNEHRSMDIVTPRNVYLSAFYKRSMGFHTLKNRLPVILTQTIDILVRSKEEIGEKYGQEAQDELKTVIGEISKLKYEIQTNKPIPPLSGSEPDVPIYNDWIAKQSSENGQATYFHTIFLLAECYMYRRIHEIFASTKHLKNYDYFFKNKSEAYYSTIPLMEQLGNYLLRVIGEDNVEQNFISLLKLNLWGNKCDLSLSLGKKQEHQQSLFDISAFEPYILCDHSKQVYESLKNVNDSSIVDIIHDNAGYEVFTDFCLADYIVSKGLAKKIRLYVKAFPWYISDTITSDIKWILGEMKNSDIEILKTLSDRWSTYLQNGTWTVEESTFWTLPFEFKFMAQIDPKLYKKLAEAKLIIFKGDLNYRKLFGELNWNPRTPVDVALQGFHPSRILSLRTLKCDIVCGIEKPGFLEQFEADCYEWMTSSEYGTIQFSPKINPIN